MDHEQATRFAQQWVRDWNSHDVDAILGHFHEDVLFTSPVAARIAPNTGGVLRGRAALRAYWVEGLRRIPDLRFEIVGVFVGIDTVVINYRNHAGGLVCEVLRMDGDLVLEGHGTYLSDDAAGASGVRA